MKILIDYRDNRGLYMQRVVSFVALTLGLSSNLICADAPRENWPQFRGPEGSGISSAAAGVKFGPGTNMLWKIALPEGHSSPSVWGNRIFISGVDRKGSKLEVISIDRSDGKILWRREIPVEKFETVHDVGNPATATPATDGERVYAYFGSFGLICFDFAGKEIWRLPLPVANVPFGSGTSPIVVGDLLILNRDESREPYLLAVDRRTGNTVWKGMQNLPGQNRFGMGKATPVVWKDEIVIHRSGEIVGFDLKTGARKWWITTISQGTGTPVASPEMIYVGTWFNRGEPDLRTEVPPFEALLKEHDKDGDGLLVLEEMPETWRIARRVDVVGITGADFIMQSKDMFPYLDKNKDGKLDASEWAAYTDRFKNDREHGVLAIRPGGRGDVTTTNILWKESRAVPEIPAPLFLQNRLYTVTNGGIVSCIEAITGTLVFRQRLGAGGPYFASPVAAGGKIYFASGDGVVSVIGAGEQMQVLARNDIAEPIFATPAIVDGTIYVRTAKSLYAFRK
jgi:outer membrane protein assembly factor BamB